MPLVREAAGAEALDSVVAWSVAVAVAGAMLLAAALKVTEEKRPVPLTLMALILRGEEALLVASQVAVVNVVPAARVQVFLLALPLTAVPSDLGVLLRLTLVLALVLRRIRHCPNTEKHQNRSWLHWMDCGLYKLGDGGRLHRKHPSDNCLQAADNSAKGHSMGNWTWQPDRFRT